jgi:hypothetical protein
MKVSSIPCSGVPVTPVRAAGSSFSLFTYLTREAAGQLAIPVAYDWWLLDDERLLMMRYTAAGEIDSKEIITTPGIVARHREWRNLAVGNAQAREILAA